MKLAISESETYGALRPAGSEGLLVDIAWRHSAGPMVLHDDDLDALPEFGQRGIEIPS